MQALRCGARPLALTNLSWPKQELSARSTRPPLHWRHLSISLFSRAGAWHTALVPPCCAQGFYSPSTVYGETHFECLDCATLCPSPDQECALCPWGTDLREVQTLPGFWRSTEESDEVREAISGEKSTYSSCQDDSYASSQWCHASRRHALNSQS